MINWTTLLHQVIDLELDVDEAKELTIGPETRKQTIFVALDVELAKLANSNGWFKVLDQPKKDPQSHLNITCNHLNCCCCSVQSSSGHI